MLSTTSMEMCCDNQAAIFITNNHIFHELTNFIMVDCQFILDFFMHKHIVTQLEIFLRSSWLNQCLSSLAQIEGVLENIFVLLV